MLYIHIEVKYIEHAENRVLAVIQSWWCKSLGVCISRVFERARLAILLLQTWFCKERSRLLSRESGSEFFVNASKLYTFALPLEGMLHRKIRFCAAECSWICFWNWKYLQVHCLTSPLEISESFFSSSFVHALRLSRLWIDVLERRRYYIVQPKSCSLSSTAVKSFCCFLADVFCIWVLRK